MKVNWVVNNQKRDRDSVAVRSVTLFFSLLTSGSNTVKYELTANIYGTTRTADIICIGDKGPFYTYKVVQG